MLWIARAMILLSHSFLCCECPSHVLGTEEQQGLVHKLPMKYQVNNRLPQPSYSSHSKLAVARCETTPKQRPLGDYTEIVLTDSNATKMKPFYCVTRAREIPLCVKIRSVAEFFVNSCDCTHTVFSLFIEKEEKGSLSTALFPDLRTCMGASLVWLGAGSKLTRCEKMRSSLSKEKEVWTRLSCHSNNSIHILLMSGS